MSEEKTAGVTVLETAEQAVIGSILIDARCLGDVLTAVRDEDFPGQQYRRIFAAARTLFTAGQPVDIVTIIDKAGSDLRDLAAGCMDVTPTAANVLHYSIPRPGIMCSWAPGHPPERPPWPCRWACTSRRPSAWVFSAWRPGWTPPGTA